MKGKIAKKFLATILSISLLLQIGGPLVYADEGNTHTYDISQGPITIKKGEAANTLTVSYGDGLVAEEFDKAEMITLTGTTTSSAITVEAEAEVEANITLSGVHIDVSKIGNKNAFVIIGNDSKVNLTLDGKNTLKSGQRSAGLEMQGNSELTIDGPGELTAIGGQSAAGIGGGYAGSLIGKVEIIGGTVTAIGGTSTREKEGAGIGGGSQGGEASGELSGTVKITGGIVTATGGVSSAGIGGGAGGKLSGTVEITGGTVTATGGDFGSGIGGGAGYSLSGMVKITGGTVTATGGKESSGIGGGSGGVLSGMVEITSGTVTATGGDFGSGIGGGASGALSGTVKITGGAVTATGGKEGSGIGGAYRGALTGTVKITRGTVTATGGDSSAGIGGGSEGELTGMVEITGGKVTATGGDAGAGIGGSAIYSLSGSVEIEGQLVVSEEGKKFAIAEGTVLTKVYDGETFEPTYGIPGSGTILYSYQHKNGENYEDVTGSSKNVGEYKVKTSISKEEGKINITAKFEIRPKEVTIRASIKSKTYDGNTIGEIDTFSIEGKIVEDNLEIDKTNILVAFSDATVGENKDVTVSGIRLTGNHAANYITADTITTTGTIKEAPKSGAKDITAFTVPAQIGESIIDTESKTITLTVANGTELSNLLATFVASEKATVKVNETIQESGTIENDFTNPVTYTVVAEDATVQNWIVTVTVANAEQNAPQGLKGIAPTTIADNDGEITGTTSDMEYKLKSGEEWTPATATKITGLSAGRYEIRYKEKPGYNAGTVVEVEVPAYVKSSNTEVTEVKVKNNLATQALNNIYNIELAVGTVLSELTASDIQVTLSDARATQTPATTSDGGASWIVQVTAEDGTTKTYTIKLTVKEVDKAVITLIKSPEDLEIVVKKGETVIEAVAGVYSLEAGNYTYTATKEGYLTLTDIEFTVNEAQAQAKAKTVEVTMMDSQAPTITLLGEASVTLANGADYTDAGATAQDNKDGVITEKIQVTISNDLDDETTFDNTKAATYTYHYNVSDAAGNKATEVTRIVIVEADPAVAANIASVSTVKDLVAGASYEMAQAEATDEAAVKTAIEAVISQLALDGVTTRVIKTLYMPAVAGTAQATTGTNGTYTFTVALSKGLGVTLAESTTETLTMTIKATAYVKSTDASISGIKVKERPATVDGSDATAYTIELAAGTVLADLQAADIAVTAIDERVSVATATTSDNGATWTVEVTAEDGTTKATYTINVTVAPNANQVAPEGLEGVAPTSVADNDGKITGTSVEMEYKRSSDTDWTPATESEITGLAAGTYQVRYAAKPGYNAGAVTSVEVAAYLAPVAVNSVSLNKTALHLEEGSTESLTATVLPDDASNKKLTWVSHNESIAQVNEAGLVKAIAKGETTITVNTEDGGHSASCYLVVKAVPSVPTPDPTPPSGGGGAPTTPKEDDRDITVTTPDKKADKSNPVTQATVTVTPTITKDTASVKLSQSAVDNAIKKAQEEAKKNKTEKDGIQVEIKLDSKAKKTNNIAADLPKETVDALAKAGVKELVISSNIGNFGLDLETLKTIQNEIEGDVKISASKVDNTTLSEVAKAVVGNRPVYNFSITGSDGQKVTQFGKGKVSIALPYTLGENEKAENIVVYYIDEDSQVHEMPNSLYDEETGTISFQTDHFSKFAIGYKEDKEEREKEGVPSEIDLKVFTDIATHWAKKDIEFVVSRGLFGGTAEGIFSPNMSMTRGMLVTVLSRLAKADLSSYTSSHFVDVKPDDYYMSAIEWANEKGIVNGIGESKFAPKTAITREQMAVIIANYARVIGIEMPKVHTESIFADNAQITSYAKAAVKEMQISGIISGKDKNQFDPQETATRAEVSAVLKRFIDIHEK